MAEVGVEKQQVLKHMDSAASLASSASEQAQASLDGEVSMVTQPFETPR